MVRVFGIVGCFIVAMAAGGGAHAAEPVARPACAAPATIPSDLLGWQAPHRRLKAATRADDAGKALLATGTAADVTLAPTTGVAYAVAPGKPGGPVTYGGLLAFKVSKAGRYRVVQNARSWVDVIVAGKVATSVGHGHGPECSGITKMVEYDLAAGRYLLQIAGSGKQAVAVMVSPVR